MRTEIVSESFVLSCGKNIFFWEPQKVVNDSYVWITVRHPVFLSQKMDYDRGFLQLFIFFSVHYHLLKFVQPFF